MNQKGFTLLEVLVAIVIITSGLAAALSLVAVTISSAAISRDRLIAVNLAQENLEVLRNIRDSNWLAQRDWLTGIFITANINVNYNSDALADFDDQLYFDGTYYRHIISGETPNTPFKRHLEVFVTSPPAVVKAKSVVEWTKRNRTGRVVLEETLYNWK